MKLFASLLTAGVIVGAGNAYATSINFEEFGAQPGTFVNQRDVLDTDYSGVTFSGGWEILNESGNFGVSAESGEHFAAFNTGVAGISDTLGLVFDDAISSISAFVGFGLGSEWTISGFLNGALVSSSVFSQTGGDSVEIGLTGLFDEITISSDQFAGVLDDLSFQTAATVAPVPLPAGAVLLGSALIGLSFARRGRKSKA